MFARALKVLVNGVALASTAMIALAHPTSAQARLRFEIAPALGFYGPTRQLPFFPWIAYERCGSCPGPRLKQNPAMAVGGRATAWLNQREAIEGSFWYSRSGVTGSDNYTFSTVSLTAAGKIVLADLRFVLRLAGPASRMSVLLMGGPAVIHRFGDYYTDYAPFVGSVTGTTSFGGTLGTGLDIYTGHCFGFRAQIEDYLYSIRFEGSDPRYADSSERKVQQDFVFSLSLSPFSQHGKGR
jgi:hypothetical protein